LENGRLEIKVQSPTLPKEDIDKAVELYQLHGSIREVTRITGHAKGVLSSHLKERGIEIKRGRGKILG
jgi:hypothetical protein